MIPGGYCEVPIITGSVISMLPAGKTYRVCFVCINNIEFDARTLNLAVTLAKKGYDVCIAGTVDSSFSKEKFSGIDIYPVIPPASGKFWKKWRHFNKHVLKFKGKIRADIFQAADLYSLYAAIKLAAPFKSRIFYDSREIYSALGPLSNHPIKQKVISYLEKKWLHSVERIIVSGEMDAEYLKQNLTDAKPYHLIMNLPPFREVKKRNLIRDKYHIPEDNLVIIYQGVVLEGRGIKPMIRALPFIENAVFVVIGEGHYINEFRAEADALNVSERVLFHGAVPYEELPEWTASGDIGIVFIEPITMSYKLALPNKLFEHIMAGIPSVISSLPAMKAVVELYPVGVLLPPKASPRDLSLAIRNIASKDNYKKYTDACRQASKVYCYESQESEILRLFS